MIQPIITRSDVLYVKNEALDLVPIRLMSICTKVPVICGTHTALLYFGSRSLRAHLHNQFYRSVCYSRILSFCRLIHVIDGHDMAVLSRMGIESSKLRFLPLWIDANKFRPFGDRESAECFRVLFVGALDEKEGSRCTPPDHRTNQSSRARSIQYDRLPYRRDRPPSSKCERCRKSTTT